MEEDINIEWFKKNMLPALTGYKVSYRFFKKGDFGDDERVEFEGKNKGGSIDFWSTGWLGMHLYHYKEEQELINVLLEPSENLRKLKSIETLKKLLR